MENEILNFFKVWVSILGSLCYCNAVGKIIPHGIPRLLFIFPVISLFLLLPLSLHSLHLGGLTAFFIAWLANFKLLLFSFGRGPLAAAHGASIGSFCTLASLPIKFQQPQNCSESAEVSSPANYGVKILLVVALVRAYDYSEKIPQKVVWVLMSFHIYLLLELSLSMAADLGRSLLGIELEPPFNKPYLSTSLQDFWGRRWNLTVTRILRPSVYQPTLDATARVVGRRGAAVIAVMATFLVSAIMHELMFYYMSREWPPTGEVFGFFVLHGVCLVVEVMVKRVWREKWRLPPIPAPVSVAMTLGFFFSTCFWLFFPPFINTCRADVRVVEEYAIVAAFVKSIVPRGFVAW